MSTQKERNRRCLEWILAAATTEGGVIRPTAEASPITGSVYAVRCGGAAVHPPPLTQWQQLFLSAILGEPIPPAVLLGALEDSGVYPDGVTTAAHEAENAPLDMGNPVYDDGEGWLAGHQRWRDVAEGWYRGQGAQVYGVCKGVFGRGNPAVGNMFSRFLDAWLGIRKPPVDHSRSSIWRKSWPTTEYLRSRMDQFPPLPRVFRHLRETANPETAALFTRLIDHLERR